MDLVEWIVLVALLAVLTAGTRRWLLFPGAGRTAFGSAYAPDRRALAQARRRFHDERRRVRRELRPHHSALSTAKRSQQKRIRIAERALAEAQAEPGHGERLRGLDNVVLHRHMLRVDGRQIPLAEVEEIRAQRSGPHTELVIGLPYGGVVRVDYLSGAPKGGTPAEAGPGAEATRRSYWQVRSFADAVSNAAAAERRRLDELPALVERLEEELAEAKADTVGIDKATTALEEARARATNDAALRRARSAWDEACEEWFDLTGRRPAR